ncbi:MAG TPA: hypothetical protein VNW30_10345 [Opitutaceae bacterium]|nr:hypothetical protein [Opitutaceae bacterium]
MSSFHFSSIFNSRGLLWIALGLLAAHPVRSLACSACGCSVNSDWTVQGSRASSGVGLDVRYEYLDQSDLRSGEHDVNRATLPIPNEREIQQATLSRNVWLGLSYAASDTWNFTAQLPVIDRFHTTIVAGDTDVSSSRTHSVGDLKLLAGYQGFSAMQNLGVQFGLKLPTGRFNQNFAAGPQAGGLLDRGLQAGTGTTDGLLGVFKSGSLTPSLGYFSQALLDQPLASRDEFRPGTSVNANAGLRYAVSRWLEPQLQLDAHWEARESGELADRDNSGATQLLIAPGLTIHVATHLDAYAFVQVPLWQHVNGLQLESRWLLSTGVRWRL